MIPRPLNEWRFNEEESKRSRDCLVAAISKLDRNPVQKMDSSDVLDDSDLGKEEGVEVSDLLKLEDGLLVNESTPIIPLQRQRQESLYGDWGVEVVDEYDDEAQFARRSWRESSMKISNADLLGLSDSNDDDDDDDGYDSRRDGREEGTVNNPVAPVEEAVTLAATRNDESAFSEGVEAVDLFEEEAAFVLKTYRTCSVSTNGSTSMEEGEPDTKAAERSSHRMSSYDVNVDGAEVEGTDQAQSAEGRERESDEEEKQYDKEEITRIRTMEAQPGASARELGVEIVEDFGEEKSYKE
jgi:hypothetical protein